MSARAFVGVIALLPVLAGCVDATAPVVDTTVDTVVREAEITGSGSREPVARNYVDVNVKYPYGSSYATVNCEPSSAICFTARSWRSPHYLWASDSTHVARKVEGILGVDNPMCDWCGRHPYMRMVSRDFRDNRLDDLSQGDTLLFISLNVSIDSLETSRQLLDSIRGAGDLDEPRIPQGQAVSLHRLGVQHWRLEAEVLRRFLVDVRPR